MNKLILSLLFLSGCASGSGGQSASGNKSIASVWAVASNPNWVFNLDQFSESQYFIVTEAYTSGGSCESFATATATDIVLSGSQTLVSVSGMANCSQFDGTWDYTITNNELTMCPGLPGPCVVFH